MKRYVPFCVILGTLFIGDALSGQSRGANVRVDTEAVQRKVCRSSDEMSLVLRAKVRFTNFSDAPLVGYWSPITSVVRVTSLDKAGQKDEEVVKLELYNSPLSSTPGSLGPGGQREGILRVTLPVQEGGGQFSYFLELGQRYIVEVSLMQPGEDVIMTPDHLSFRVDVPSQPHGKPCP